MNFYETLTPQTYIRTQYLCFLQSSGMCLRAKFIIRSDLSSPCKLATCTETWGQIQDTDNVFLKKNYAFCVIRYVRLVVSSIFFFNHPTYVIVFHVCIIVMPPLVEIHSRSYSFLPHEVLVDLDSKLLTPP